MELINSRNDSTLITEEWLTQLKGLIKHLALREEMGVGMPSKHLLFLSIHKHNENTSRNQKPDLFDGLPRNSNTQRFGLWFLLVFCGAYG